MDGNPGLMASSSTEAVTGKGKKGKGKAQSPGLEVHGSAMLRCEVVLVKLWPDLDSMFILMLLMLFNCYLMLFNVFFNCY